MTIFIYGQSTAHQRIAAWWSTLRKQCSDWWIKHFKDLRREGVRKSGGDAIFL